MEGNEVSSVFYSLLLIFELICVFSFVFAEIFVATDFHFISCGVTNGYNIWIHHHFNYHSMLLFLFCFTYK
jgi:hypothetical protein